MADRTHDVLRAASRSLERVVGPAISESDPLAHEQAKLIAAHLRFLDERLQYQYDRSRFEVWYYLKVAKAVQETLDQQSCTDEGLQEAVQRAVSLLELPGGRPPDLERAAAALRRCLSRIVRHAGRENAPAESAVEKIVLDEADEILEFQRAWFLPQGWDPDEAAVTRLEDLLPPGAAKDQNADVE